MVSKPITLSSSPEDPATLQWETTEPYQSTITVIQGGQIRLENVTVRHSSPSVANNYAIFVQGGRAEVTSCDISSRTGSGIGVEGGMITVTSSKVHDCQGNGAVVAGSIDLAGGMDASDDGTAPASEVCHSFTHELMAAPSLHSSATRCRTASSCDFLRLM